MEGVLQVVGKEHELQLFGIRMVGVSGENLKKLIITLVFILALVVLRWLARWVANRLLGKRQERVQFWVRQGIGLTSAVLLVLGIVSIWFSDPSRLASAAAFITAGLAIASQRLITAVAGYFIILRGKNFNVGDRIVMGGVRGDVIALGFTQTTIMEMGQPPGEQADAPSMWVAGRQYTGRMVTLTNDKIFDSPVYNYTREFPYIWEEMRLPIPYKADRHEAERILLEAARKHTTKVAELSEGALRELEKRYVVKAPDLEPRVYFRLTDNWVEMSVRIITEDHGVRGVKDAMSRQILDEFDRAGLEIASGTYEIVGMPDLNVKLTSNNGGPAIAAAVMKFLYSADMTRVPCMLLAGAFAALAQNTAPPAEVAGIPVNYDEAKAGSYTLPDPLTLANGKKVTDAKTWREKRRPEIVKLFEENQYGAVKKLLPESHFRTFEGPTPAFDGKAIRKQATVYFSGDENGPKVDVLIYLPPEVKNHPVPLLLNASFSANSSAVDDPGVKPGEIWGRDKKRVPAPKGGFGRLNVLPILAKGFGVATLYYGDIDPDFLGGVALGVRGLYPEPAANEWGSISAWAFGLSRVLDYLATDPQVDAKKVALLGVSRLGKTVLWAGARDPRFAMVIASCSGEGGAALSRRNYGETIAHLTAPTRYPYQVAGNYAKWANRVNDSPVDANMLIALLAPRPLLLQTGSTDGWSDPRGEFLAAVAAEPVYRLLGAQGLGTDVMPEPGTPILHTLGYFEHVGGHGTLPSDWDVFLKFMEMHLRQ